MNTRERFHSIMSFKPFDQLPVVEWAAWWDKTIERWHTEGLPVDLKDRYEISKYLGLEIYKQWWFPVTKQGCPSPKAHGAGLIENEKDYDKLLPFLYPEASLAVDEASWSKWAKEQENGEVVIWFTLEGFFWFPRRLFGIERHLYAFYDQPELMHRINKDLSDWMASILERLFQFCVPDFMTFAEDMSYNHGPMLSKELFDEFMLPYYRKIVPLLKKAGVIVFVDSDGDITVPASWFEEAGIEGILPLERQSGVDISILRKQHPQMKFLGHFDKTKMHKGEHAMRQEFERLLPLATKGGFVIGCDHQTPPEVSFKDYLLYISLFKEYAVLAGKISNCQCQTPSEMEM